MVGISRNRALLVLTSVLAVHVMLSAGASDVPTFPPQAELDKFCVTKAQELGLAAHEGFVWSPLKGYCVDSKTE